MSQPETCLTRYAELGYRQDVPDLWRIVDRTTRASIGPQYRTKGELFGDLDRLARDFGCKGASHLSAVVTTPRLMLDEERDASNTIGE